MRVALVHDWLNQYGGAERVLEILVSLFPGAPIYTALYDAKAMPAKYRQWDIRTSFLQWLPGAGRYHQALLPLYPLAFDQFDLSDYDLVISNSSGFGHGVVTSPGAHHICYCLTPPRYLWGFQAYARQERLWGPFRALLLPFISWARVWDQVAAERVDHFLVISKLVGERVRKYYRREATVLHPPVDCTRFSVAREVGDFFLVVSRLVPYKRIDLAVSACTRLGLRLKVAGGGRDRRRLEQLAGPTVEFTGRVTEETLRDLYAHCRALIFPGEEDFGLTPLEAMACGRPVIAYAAGGALETVVDGVSGLFFSHPTEESLAEALERFQSHSFEPREVRRQAELFDTSIFVQK
ncbi:MAG: glycosyltransferase, partial [Chloroflexi bacterium]|nr:glycosyltransferase [Chloroflexota bacterium]